MLISEFYIMILFKDLIDLVTFNRLMNLEPQGIASLGWTLPQGGSFAI